MNRAFAAAGQSRFVRLSLPRIPDTIIDGAPAAGRRASFVCDFFCMCVLLLLAESEYRLLLNCIVRTVQQQQQQEFPTSNTGTEEYQVVAHRVDLFFFITII